MSSNPITKIFRILIESQSFFYLRKVNLEESKNNSPKKRKNSFNSNIEIEESKINEKKIESHSGDVEEFLDDLMSQTSKDESNIINFENFGKNFEILLKKFICPLKYENEILHFQETLKKLKENNREIFNILISSLNEKEKQSLNEIFELKKMENEENGKPSRNYRKIIHTKGKKKIQSQSNQEKEGLEINY